MKKFAAVTALCCLLMLTAVPAFSAPPAGFTEQDITITKNGAPVTGRAFARIDDPATMLVLSGNAAFLVNKTARTVYRAAIKSINDAAAPVMIDYGVLAQIEGAGLIVGTDGEIAFLADWDRYDVRPRSSILPEP
jgi:hypothetical protein